VHRETSVLRVAIVPDGKVLYEQPAPRSVCCVRFRPNGKRLAMSGYGGLVYLCNSDTSDRLMTLKGSNIPPGAYPVSSRVIFSPDGKQIATNNWLGQIKVWEAKASTLSGRGNDPRL
jgi:eukaryotic-like serine/threonine-protein kinase